jgi:hypothetical protein
MTSFSEKIAKEMVTATETFVECCASGAWPESGEGHKE